MKISQAISRTTGPNTGLFVLFLIHFPCRIQIWTRHLVILFFLQFLEKMKVLYTPLNSCVEDCCNTTVIPCVNVMSLCRIFLNQLTQGDSTNPYGLHQSGATSIASVQTDEARIADPCVFHLIFHEAFMSTTWVVK